MGVMAEDPQGGSLPLCRGSWVRGARQSPKRCERLSCSLSSKNPRFHVLHSPSHPRGKGLQGRPALPTARAGDVGARGERG